MKYLNKCKNSIIHFKDKNSKQQEINYHWSQYRILLASFQVDIDKFIQKGKENSELFHYWDLFVNQIIPVARNLIQAHREGNWPLYLSAVRSAIPLFFAFNHTNYSRWTFFFKDCLNLEETFPLIYQEFIAGNFVRLTQCKRSAIPMDKANEKEYDKVAKGGGGVIGITPRKEAVAQWKLINHEKVEYLRFLQELCDIDEDGEYNLHHEFSKFW